MLDSFGQLERPEPHGFEVFTPAPKALRFIAAAAEAFFIAPLIILCGLGVKQFYGQQVPPLAQIPLRFLAKYEPSYAGAPEIALFYYLASIVGAVALYYIVFETSPLSATPGKVILRLSLSTIDDEPIGFFGALLRNAGKFVFVVPVAIVFAVIQGGQLFSGPEPDKISLAYFGGNVLFWSILSSIFVFATVLFSPDSRGIHDLLGGALVEQRDDPSVLRIIAAIILAALGLAVIAVL